ncbi:MAG: hypothetical protein EBX35_06515 [Planctomycetia bacterium]|nr:hypothetical protein [Planctomycetia bacterium]
MGRKPSPASGRALVAAAFCAAALAGCTMCPDPYDYSGPVPNGSAPQNDFRARSNGIAPIGAAPRPWPPVVRKDQVAPSASPSGSTVRVAVATTTPAAEAAAADVIEPVSDAVVDLVTEPVVEELVADAPPGPEAEPVTESTGDLAGDVEAPAADAPGEPAAEPAGDGWQPILFR